MEERSQRGLIDSAIAGTPDLMVLDIAMPGLNGIAAAARVKDSGSVSKVVFVTNLRDREFVDESMHQTVFEVTEQHPITDRTATLAMVDCLRRAGGRIAVDDTGAGFASLSHLLSFRPDIVKLDRALTDGIETDPVRQALASALVEFCGATGTVLVAEGIEDQATYDACAAVGCDSAQGFFVGRPMVATAIPAWLAQGHLTSTNN